MEKTVVRGGDKKRLGEYVGRFLSKCNFFLQLFWKRLVCLKIGWKPSSLRWILLHSFLFIYLFFCQFKGKILNDGYLLQNFNLDVLSITKQQNDFYPCSRINLCTQNNNNNYCFEYTITIWVHITIVTIVMLLVWTDINIIEGKVEFLFWVHKVA